MRDINKNNINYRPQITYDKDYYTEGVFSTGGNLDLGGIETLPLKDKDNIIQNLLDKINNTVSLLPDDIKDSYLDVLKPTTDEWQNILDDLLDKDTNPPIDPTNPTKPDIDDPKFPDIENPDIPNITDPEKPNITDPDTTYPEITDPDINKPTDPNKPNPDIPDIVGPEITNPDITGPDTGIDADKDKDDEINKDKEFEDIFGEEDDDIVKIPDEITWEEFIDKQYKTDYEDIYKDYLASLDKIISDYLLFILDATAKVSEIKDIPTETIKLNNQNLQHLMDYSYKSDIIVKQRLLLHKKMFSVDEAIVHLRSVKVAKQYWSRYMSEDFLENKSALEIVSNKLLEESRLVANRKYEESFFNLYKYLNSSVILLSDTLELMKKKMSSILAVSKNEL